MGFQESLEEICRGVDGALAASVMGYDGIAVELLEVESRQAEEAGVNASAAMVEYSNIFGQVRSAAAQLQAGQASELSITTDKLVTIGRVLNDDYFVVLAMHPDANLGKARYLLRVRAGKIAAEL